MAKLKKAVTGQHWKRLMKKVRKNQIVRRMRKAVFAICQGREDTPVMRRMKRHMEILMRVTEAKKVIWFMPPS